jgi:hypothetical protein
MIEFKAECGHTVRARDEDAGGVVRCSYCGRNAAVPDNVDSGLDHLFREIEETGEKDKSYKRPRKRRKKLFSKSGGAGSLLDPFSIVLKLCYVAALIIIVWVVVQKSVMPLIRGQKPINPFDRGGSTEPHPPVARHGTTPETPGMGLIGHRVPGLYVASVPTGAVVYIVEASRAPTRGRIASIQGVRQIRSDGVFPPLPDGEYIVEVTLPWHDRQLSEYKDYWSFRRAIEHANDTERRRLLDEYFIPDDAIDVFVHEAAEQIYLVRQYRTQVWRDQSRGVQALFLPRIPQDGGERFLIEPLVAEYLPDVRRYSFDEELVNNELAYYGVSATDRPFVVEALRRIGAISYMTPDGRTRLFRIGVQDGVFATRVIREPTT